MEKKSKENLIHHLSEAIECFEKLSKASGRAAAGLVQLMWAVQEDDWREFAIHLEWVAENVREMKKLYDKLRPYISAIEKGGSNEESYS